MKRMSGTDAFLLGIETPRCYMHTLKIAIIDPTNDPDGWSFARYRQQVTNRLHLIPAFRLKYVPSPLGLGHPLWVEDADFNLDYHLRRVACPAPGDQRALCQFMSDVYAYQLDRSRPLWMSWVVEGLENGRVALVTMVHHAYFDGVGASYAMRQYFSQEPGYEPPAPAQVWQGEKPPSWFKALLLGVRDLPGVIAQNLPKLVSGIKNVRALEKRYEEEGKPKPPAPGMMPKTPINKALSHGRSFFCDTIPLERMQSTRRTLGVTLNDLYLSCCAGAVRKLLRDLDYNPDNGPLVAGIPISGARPEDMQGEGNFATVDYTWLHVEIEDPMARLRASRRSAQEMKEHMEAARGADITSLVQLSPPWLTKLIRWRINAQQGKFGLFGNILLSNVPGPRESLYLGNAVVENWFSTGQIFDGTGINMTLWSYCKNANLCVLADSEILPDAWVVFNYFCQELEALEALAQEQTLTQENAAMVS
jgi:diacylglycerol O-acyltransferase